MCGILKISSQHPPNYRTKRKFENKLEDTESDSESESDSKSTTKSKSKSDRMNSRLQIKHSKWGGCKFYTVEDSKSKNLKLTGKTVVEHKEEEVIPQLVKPASNLEMEMFKENPRVVLPNCHILKDCLLNGSKKIRIQRSLEAEKEREREMQRQKEMEVQMALKQKEDAEEAERMRRKEKRFQRLQCPHCSFICYAPRRMNRHSLSHLYQTRFPCSKCNHSFGSETVLALHAKTHGSSHQKNKNEIENVNINECMNEIKTAEKNSSSLSKEQSQVQVQISQIIDKLNQDEKQEMAEEAHKQQQQQQQQQCQSKPNFKGISKTEAQIMEELEISKILLSFSSSITNLSTLPPRKPQQIQPQYEQEQEQKQHRESKTIEEISVPISMPTPTPSPVKMNEGVEETEQVRLYYQTESRPVPFKGAADKAKLVLDLQVEEACHLPTPASTPSSPPPSSSPIPIPIHMPISISLKEPLPLHSISTRIAQPRRMELSRPIPSPMQDNEVECIDLRVHRRKRRFSQSTNSNSSSHRGHLLPRKRHRAPPSNNLMDINGNQLPIFACPYCDYWTTEDGHLTIHMTSHADSFVPYKCSFCEYFSAEAASLTKHSSKNHGPDRDQEVPSSRAEREKKAHIKCPFPGCLYFAKHRSLLRSHQIVHTQEKAFCCEICLKKFGRRSDKNRHMRSHGRLNNMSMNMNMSRSHQLYPVHRPHHEIYQNQDGEQLHHIPFVRSPPMEKMQTQSVERTIPLLSYPASVIKFGSDYHHAHSRDERSMLSKLHPRANWE